MDKRLAALLLAPLLVLSILTILVYASEEEKRLGIAVSHPDLSFVGVVGQTFTGISLAVRNTGNIDEIVNVTYTEEGGPFLLVNFTPNFFILKPNELKTVNITITVLEGAIGNVTGFIEVQARPALKRMLKGLWADQ